MAIQLGAEWEKKVLNLPSIQPAGINVADVDPGSLEVVLINPDGPSTIRCTLVLSVDSDELRGTIRDSVTPA